MEIDEPFCKACNHHESFHHLVVDSDLGLTHNPCQVDYCACLHYRDVKVENNRI